jgi:integrase
MKKGTKPEVLELQKNPFVEQWMAGVASRGGGSEDTQRGYIYSFNRMLGYLGETPDSLIKKAKKDISAIERELTLWGFRAEKTGMNRSTRVDHEITVRSFLKHNGLILRTPATKRRKAVGRDVISLNDLRKLMDHSPLKLRAYIALAKDTGLAPVDILNLKYGQVKGLLEKEPPAVLELIRKKTGTKFKTCLGHDALRFLHEYLDTKRRARDTVEGWRIRKFIIPKGISDDEYIFTTGSIADKKLSRKTLWLQFTRTARRAGVDIQPYDLRRFFSTQLRTSSGTVGGLNELYIKYMMGHEIGVDDSYFKPTDDQVKTEYGQRYQSLALEGVAVSKADLEEAEEKADEKVAKVEDKLKALERENAELKAFMQERVETLERLVTKTREAVRPPPEGKKSR